MPRRPVKRANLAGPYAGIAALGAANYSPQLSAGGVSEGGELMSPRYATPTFGENFWTGGKAGQQVGNYNQQLLMQQLREQDALAKAAALERAKVQAGSDKMFQEQGNIQSQIGDTNVARMGAGQSLVPRPILSGSTVIGYPEKMAADESAAQLAGVQSKALIPGAREAAIAEQGSKRNIDLEKGLKAFQGTNTLLDNPNLTSSNMLGENEKLGLANKGAGLENTKTQNLLNTGYTPITPNFIADRNNNLFSSTPGVAEKPFAITTDPTTGQLKIGNQPAKPPQLQQIPNPSLNTGKIQAPQMSIKRPTSVDDLPTREPGESLETYTARVKAMYPGL